MDGLLEFGMELGLEHGMELGMELGAQSGPSVNLMIRVDYTFSGPVVYSLVNQKV
jgi:hypothetical protein